MAIHNIAGSEAFDDGREVYGMVSFIKPRRKPTWWRAVLSWVLG